MCVHVCFSVNMCLCLCGCVQGAAVAAPRQNIVAGVCRVPKSRVYSTAWCCMYIRTPYTPDHMLAQVFVGCQNVVCIVLCSDGYIVSHPTHLLAIYTAASRVYVLTPYFFARCIYMYACIY